MARSRKTPEEKALHAAVRALEAADPALADARKFLDAHSNPFNNAWLLRPRTPEEDAACRAHDKARQAYSKALARALRRFRLDLDEEIESAESRAKKSYDPNWGKGVEGAAPDQEAR